MNVLDFNRSLMQSSVISCKTLALKRQMEIMQRASSFFVGSKIVYNELEIKMQGNSADWLYEEADVIMSHQRPKSEKRFQLNREITCRQAMTLAPFLALTPDSVFVEVGTHCRGRLPLNLSLSCKAKAYISICPDLQQAVNASQLASSLTHSDLLQAPVSFVCSHAHSWHYRGASHILLHNNGERDHVSLDACRTIAAKLSTSPDFKLLLTTAPLPFQPHLVHVGETDLQAPQSFLPPAGDEAVEEASHIQMMSSSADTDNQLGAHSSIKGQDLSSHKHAAQHKSINPQWSSREKLLEGRTNISSLGTLHMYSTSLEAAPVGTLANLYCRSGVCCLPGISVPGIRKSSSPMVDNVVSGNNQPGVAPQSQVRIGRDSSTQQHMPEGVLTEGMPLIMPWLPPLAAFTSSYLDLCAARI
ncbi:hypothetical protein CEUSTIGMA_g9117.t1 [Chlamydomonas eustigma]|uniref:Uncharacterized protein n=1 Tax=Chlamydomonas eustigma TaxID=1157962 RepID=A0A250XFK1_9CHLO|nr:hypothetical protein CEUSTIGMA_g9117.t1 [Chlamydomonas eustigma]|eukprot:GAX81689.1 hypothetical protein CEUSTIGMA_g9117.t1 [Chlamydomonas eustigma]